MSESQALSHLIGTVYDAALDPSQWRSVLHETSLFLRAHSTVLGSFDALQASVNFNFSWGDDPAYTATYREKYARQNPFIPASLEQRIGDVEAASRHPLYREMLASAFYRDWVKPQGLVDGAQAILEQSGTALAVLVAMRHEDVGVADDEMMRRMALLVPHFRRAVMIGKAIDLKTVQAAAFAETIDGLATGIFLVDGEGRIVHANQSGKDLLAGGSVIKEARARLAAADKIADRALREAIGLAGREAELAGKGIAVGLPGSDGDYLANVLPLVSGVRRAAAAAFSAAAAVFVRRAGAPSAFPAELLRDRYRLTPTEIQVFRRIVEAGGVRATADGLGQSPATVKTHLHRIFQKTGAKRQSDLVRLAARLASPLEG